MSGLPRIGSQTNVATMNATRENYESLVLRAMGRGILSGFGLTTGTGLTVNVAAGEMIGTIYKSLPSGTVTLAGNGTWALWVNEDGTTLANNGTDPGGTYARLGTAVVTGGAITSVTTSGRWNAIRSDAGSLKYGSFSILASGEALTPEVRTKIHEMEPVAAPAGRVGRGLLYASNVDGEPELFYIQPDGAAVQLTRNGYLDSSSWLERIDARTLTADMTMTDDSRPIVRVIASGAARSVRIPANPTRYRALDIANVGDPAVTDQNHNVTVKDSTGAVTIATLAPGQRVRLEPKHAAGSLLPSWPSSGTPETY